MHNRAYEHTPEAGGYGASLHLIHMRIDELDLEQFKVFASFWIHAGFDRGG